MKQAGQLRDRIKIEQNAGTTRDAIGGLVANWTALNAGTSDGLLWANVSPMSAGEQMRRMQINAQADWKVTVRYRSDITTKMRVIFGTRTFEIVGVVNPDMKKRFLELACKETVAR